MRTLQPWTLKLREWQLNAARKVKEKADSNETDFLCVATPGAGKTIFALRVAHYFISRGKADRVVIICPTEHLKKQWAESAYKSGLDIDPEFDNAKGKETSDFMGVSITYAQVGRAPQTHRRNCEGKKTFVIFDEIHHLGDDMSWGDSIRAAFSGAVFRLAISGTPFRRDNNPIPFVKYENSQSAADYVYGYSDAIMDNVCRPIYFPAFEGVMEWKVKNKTFSSTFEDALNESKASERLRTALDPNGKWLETVIRDADKKLNEIRNGGHSDAGGLLIAMDQKHARQISKLIESLTSELPKVVVSDDPKASKKIKKFNDSSEKWLVAVKMVSEGVDIPRLRVGVYATNIKSELFFRQAVGRFVRAQEGIKNQDAYFYIPKDYVLVDHAQQIEVERDHYINKTDYVKDMFDRDPLQKEESEEDDLLKFEAIHSEATGKTQYELDFGREYKSAEKVEKVKKRIAAMRNKPINAEEKEVPVYEIVEKLKQDIKELARLVAIRKQNGNTRVDWNLPHKEWIRMGGKSIEQETRFELEQRLQWLYKQLR